MPCMLRPADNRALPDQLAQQDRRDPPEPMAWEQPDHKAQRVQTVHKVHRESKGLLVHKDCKASKEQRALRDLLEHKVLQVMMEPQAQQDRKAQQVQTGRKALRESQDQPVHKGCKVFREQRALKDQQVRRA